MSIATEIEGHPDNITPAFIGGMTIASWEEDGSIIYRKLPWNDEWKLMVCVPDYELNTEISRSVLPKEVPMKDAVFNLKKSAMLIDALYNKDEELLKASLFDKLHQPYREKLVPGLVEIIDNLKHVNGVIGTVLCGAGPSILIIYNGIGVSEIKETVTFFVKIMIWVTCALLYVLQVLPVFYRLYLKARNLNISFFRKVFQQTRVHMQILLFHPYIFLQLSFLL